MGATRTVPLEREWDGGAYYVATAREAYDPEQQQAAAVRTVSPTFFQAVGARMLAGRTFQAGDGMDVVVNQAFVRLFMPDRNPVGEFFYWGFPVVRFGAPLRIVGVVEDIRYASLAEPAVPTFYNWGVGSRMSVIVETTQPDPASLIPRVRAAVSDVDPSVPFPAIPLEEVVEPELARQRVGLLLMSLFGLAALGLASIGVYGGVAQLSDARAPEYATRMALGASPGRIWWLVLNQGQTIVLLGAAFGLLLAYVGGRVAATQLYQVKALDPAVLGTALVIVSIMASACFSLNARMAMRRKPADGLRVGS